MIRTIRNSAGAAIAIAAFSGAAQAQNTYVWHWEQSQGGANNAGGEIKKISAMYNGDAQRLSYKMTFGSVPSHPGLKTDGFWMALSQGPNPKGHAGELALFYMDASHANPLLTVYAYNGVNGDNSYKDGSAASGEQAPDKILSSQNNPGFVEELMVVTNGDGTRTLGFTVKVDTINSHVPMYPGPNGPGEWDGAKFGSKIGIWAHSMAGLSSTYQNGWIKSLSYAKTGWLDGTNFNTTTVPEPATLAIVGIGAFAAIRRRNRK